MAPSQAFQLGLALCTFLPFLLTHAAPTPELARPLNETSRDHTQSSFRLHQSEPRSLSKRYGEFPHVQAQAVQLGHGPGNEALYWYGPDSGELNQVHGVVKVKAEKLASGSFGTVADADHALLPVPRDIEQIKEIFSCTSDDQSTFLNQVEFDKEHWVVKISQGKNGPGASWGGLVQDYLFTGWDQEGTPGVPRVRLIVDLKAAEAQREDGVLVLMEKMDATLLDMMNTYASAIKHGGPEPRWFNRFNRRVVMIRLVEIMMFVHTEGYVHGDLKPANVMVKNFADDSKQLDIKITDWDGAADLNDPSTWANIHRTDGYAPLELQEYDENESPTAYDPYSLGVILLQLAAWDSDLGHLKTLASEHRTPEDVITFLQEEMKFNTAQYPAFFEIVTNVLCAVEDRWMLSEILQSLHQLSADPRDDLPWITETSPGGIRC